MEFLLAGCTSYHSTHGYGRKVTRPLCICAISFTYTQKKSCLPEEALILNAVAMVHTVSDNVLAYIIMKDHLTYQDISWSQPKGFKYRPWIGVNIWHYFEIIWIAEKCTWFFLFEIFIKIMFHFVTSVVLIKSMWYSVYICHFYMVFSHFKRLCHVTGC